MWEGIISAVLFPVTSHTAQGMHVVIIHGLLLVLWFDTLCHKHNKIHEHISVD